MFGDDSLDIDALVPAALGLAREALEDFSASRAREGEKLATVILERVARMRELVRDVAPRIPVAQAAFQEKLKQRLAEALGSADDERIRQEVAVFAERMAALCAPSNEQNLDRLASVLVLQPESIGT